MKSAFASGLAVTLLSLGTLASFAQKTNAILGKWKGESLCTVKPSPCHDEIVVYEITAPAGKNGMFVWKADKIVNGVQENMGSLDCSYAADTRVLTCDLPNKAVWSLTVQGDSMTGTLRQADGTLYRKVSAKRAM
jgi:hypothetical protein